MGKEQDAQIAGLKRDVGALKERVKKLELGTASMREEFIARKEDPKAPRSGASNR